MIKNDLSKIPTVTRYLNIYYLGGKVYFKPEIDPLQKINIVCVSSYINTTP